MKTKIKKITHSRIFTLFLTLIFIAVCALIGVGLAFYEDANDPSPMASEYFRSFIRNDYEGMYKKLYKPEKVNKQMYIEKMRSLRQNFVIDSYDISDVKHKNAGDCLVLTCKDERTKAKRTFTAYIAKVGFWKPKFYIDLDKSKEDPQMMVDEYKNILTQSADGVMNSYYIAIREKDSKNKVLKDAFATKKLQKKAQKSVAKNIKAMFKKKNKKKKIKDYNIVDFETDNVKKWYGYNPNANAFTVVYSYKYSYKAETTTTLTDSYYYKLKGKRKARMILTYAYDKAKENVVLANIKVEDKNAKGKKSKGKKSHKKK